GADNPQKKLRLLTPGTFWPAGYIVRKPSVEWPVTVRFPKTPKASSGMPCCPPTWIVVTLFAGRAFGRLSYFRNGVIGIMLLTRRQVSPSAFESHSTLSLSRACSPPMG